MNDEFETTESIANTTSKLIRERRNLVNHDKITMDMFASVWAIIHQVRWYNLRQAGVLKMRKPL
jgi:hypothetical protein